LCLSSEAYGKNAKGDERRMQLRKISVVLLALLLAAMAIVPIVNAGETAAVPAVATMIENNYISPDTALKSANAAVKDFVGRNALDDSWNDATVNSKPDIIYDLNGKQLFYLFSVEKNRNRIGEIKAAASKVVGGSIVTIGPGAKPVDQEKIQSAVKEIVNREYPGATIDSTNLVCYNYPNIGVLVKLTVPGSGKKSLIMDAYDFSIVPKSDQVSFYNAIPSAELNGRVSRWDSDQKYLQSENTLAVASPMATVTKTISGFTLYPQENANYCAFATAQMISAYYGYYRNQLTIGNTITSTPANGASIEDTQTNYYLKTVANGGLGKAGTLISYIGMFTFNNIVSEMDANHPIHTDRFETSSYHTRAITGYSYTTTTPVSQYLYIYDPWPTTSGAVYRENWNVFNGKPNPVHAILYVRN
jgi:hypothetical protein